MEEKLYHCRQCRVVHKVVYVSDDHALNPRLAEHSSCPRCGQQLPEVTESDLDREHPDHYGYSPLDAWTERDVLRIFGIAAHQLAAAVQAGKLKAHARHPKAAPHYIAGDLVAVFGEPARAAAWRPDDPAD